MAGHEDGLRCRGIQVSFGGNKVLNAIDFTARPGFTGLIGPNGAGKTTLFNVITGYVRPGGGEVTLDGVNLARLSRHSIARRGVARTFQTPKLIQEMTVLENVMLGMDGHRSLRDWQSVVGSPRSERMAGARAREALAEFGLVKYAHHRVNALSLGSQKLIEIVRALLSKPRLLLLDEPAAGVSIDEVQRMTDPLIRWTVENNLSLVIIEHDIELISQLCPVVTVLDFGRVLVTGSPKEVMGHSEVVTAYLGASFAAERT